MYPKELKTGIQIGTRIHMLTAALFTIARRWKQATCDQWVNREPNHGLYMQWNIALNQNTHYFLESSLAEVKDRRYRIPHSHQQKKWPMVLTKGILPSHPLEQMLNKYSEN